MYFSLFFNTVGNVWMLPIRALTVIIYRIFKVTGSVLFNLVMSLTFKSCFLLLDCCLVFLWSWPSQNPTRINLFLLFFRKLAVYSMTSQKCEGFDFLAADIILVTYLSNAFFAFTLNQTYKKQFLHSWCILTTLKKTDQMDSHLLLPQARGRSISQYSATREQHQNPTICAELSSLVANSQFDLGPSFD